MMCKYYVFIYVRLNARKLARTHARTHISMQVHGYKSQKYVFTVKE